MHIPSLVAKKKRPIKDMSSAMAYGYYKFYYIKFINSWVPVSSADKVSDSCIRDLGFNPCLHQKLIGFFISDNKELLSEADVIGRNSNSLSKKKKKSL